MSSETTLKWYKTWCINIDFISCIINKFNEASKVAGLGLMLLEHDQLAH